MVVVVVMVVVEEVAEVVVVEVTTPSHSPEPNESITTSHSVSTLNSTPLTLNVEASFTQSTSNLTRLVRSGWLAAWRRARKVILSELWWKHLKEPSEMWLEFEPGQL